MTLAPLIAEWRATPQAAALATRYHEPWRHYHDWSHPLAMLRHLEAAADDGVALHDPAAAIGFVLWHDAIYDPQATHGRNERLSAALCAAEMPALAPRESVARAIAAIEATIDHRSPAGVADAALLLDIDLSILGADEGAFDVYDAGIAAEYAHVPAAAYRSGRAAVLQRFLARERLYVTPWAHERWEQRARRNLERAIARLGADVSAATPLQA